MSAQNGLVQRLWSYCNVLRDDGLSYGDYLEQLTYLLFLKMADEQTRPPFNATAFVPEGLDWPSPARARRRRAGGALPARPHRARPAAGDARGRLPQGAEPDPGSGEAAPADRRPDRPRELADARRRREGRRLRGAAREERGGREVGRRAVLHAAAADPGDRRGDATRAGDDGSATRPAARAASCSPRTSGSRAAIRTSTRTRSGTCASTRCAAGRSSTTRRASA